MVKTLLGTVAGGVLATILIAPHIVLNTTPSLPVGFYWYTALTPQTVLTGGSQVLFEPTQAQREQLRKRTPEAKETSRWMKTLQGIPGATICVDRNGAPARWSWPGFLPGAGCYTLGPTEYFVVTPHPQSFDSWHSGPITREQIRGTCRRLLTWRT